ncbi:PD-(D/E)XK motif protein [Streptomyces sp. NPDC048606]|uniref:PD-(D/E)XK motif protein n=1 Tax=Streptomyces sp. NPDC048606 TaxID=3154726 RepID=UPI0034394943
MAGPPELPWSAVEHYLGARQATSYPLSPPGAPRAVWYDIGDGGRDISLRVALDPRGRLPRSPLPAVTIDQVLRDGRRMARVRTTDVALMRDFHDLLLAIADRVVTGGRDLGRAFEETVAAWQRLLDRPRGLGVERRVGLHGELAVLAAVARSHGWTRAVDSWTGPRAEQHDFALPTCDLEVKTTSGEERAHTVHGLRQLTGSRGRPLWFASIQLTRGGAGGRSLGESATAALAAARAQDPRAADRLREALAACGWHRTAAEDPAEDDERWTPRSAPLVVPAEHLPRLTAEMIAPEVRAHLSSIDYRIHVDHLTTIEGSPVDLTDFRLP